MSSEQQPEKDRPTGSPGKGSKKSFVLRLDEDSYKALEKWAADEFRSVNGQMEWLIDQALRAAGRTRMKKGGPEETDESVQVPGD